MKREIINIKISITSIEKGDFVLCTTPTMKWVVIVDHFDSDRLYYQAAYNLTANTFKQADWCRYAYVTRIANKTEKKKLLEAIVKNGYEFQAQTLHVVPAKELLVPDSVKIYRIRTENTHDYNVGDGLFIGCGTTANNLICSGDIGYCVFKNNENLFESVKCKLVPCEFSELKKGDTAFKEGATFETDKVAYYVKILDKEYVSFHEGHAIRNSYTSFDWYKVVPLSNSGYGKKKKNCH